MYHISLKRLLSDIDDPEGNCSPRSRKPKRTKVRFCISGHEVELLSVYTDGRAIWFDLERLGRRKD